VRYCN